MASDISRQTASFIRLSGYIYYVYKFPGKLEGNVAVSKRNTILHFSIDLLKKYFGPQTRSFVADDLCRPVNTDMVSNFHPYFFYVVHDFE